VSDEATRAAGSHGLALVRSLAGARQREGRLDEACALFERAVALAPSDPNGWAALAGCLLLARRPQAAMEACEAGLRGLPRASVLHVARARILQSLSRVPEAAGAYHRALALDAGSAEARLGLALQAIEAGDWAAASELAAPLLASPNPGPQLDWLGARLAFGRGDFEETCLRTRRMLAAAGLSADQSAETALLTGEALDALGRTAEAFQAFRLGKNALHAFYAERAASRESEVDKLTRLAAWFRAADPAPWRAPQVERTADPGARGHAFLFGFPRSGTTLLEQALAGHPDLVALEEPPTLAEAYDAFLTTPQGLERLARLTAAEAAHWRGVYWRVVAERGTVVGGKVFLDKAPAGTLYLPLVAKIFPDAKVLFALRDPRDVVLSCFRSSFQINALTYAFTDLAEAARCYVAVMDLAAVYREMLPIALQEVRYEQLIDDFESELGRIASFLGLQLTPSMLDVAATASRRVVRTPSAPQVRAGLNRQGLGRWRAYNDELAPAMPILEPWIERLGYGGAG
jgi:tetratricopeptide (TPR) repeat protein